METDSAKRWAKQKGDITFNPNQSFLIQCQWIVPNLEIAHEMIEGLRKCAVATERDTPSVVCYFFRISHDQSLAHEMRENVRTISQHPHYAKGYKMMDMNMTKEFVISKCQREGISALPFEAEWSRDELIEAHASEFNFDPVVIDLTELYSDNRSMVDHACSKDYMEGYGVLLTPHRSLQPYTVVAGTPTEGMWSSLLEPILKARRVEVELDSLERLFLNIPSNSPPSSQQSPYYVFLDIDVKKEEATKSVVSLFVDKLRDELQAEYQGVVLNQQQSAYRVVQACSLDTFVHVVTSSGILSAGDIGGLGVSGRVFILPLKSSPSTRSPADIASAIAPCPQESEAFRAPTESSINELAHLQQTLRIHIYSEIVIAYASDALSAFDSATSPKGEAWWVGHGLHCKYQELRPDESVFCKEIPN